MTSFLPAAARPAARELLMTPARRIILLLGVPLSLTLLAWTCFAIISQASQGSYAVSYAPVRVIRGLDMNIYGGDVTLQGGVAPSAARFTGSGTVWYGLNYSGQRPTRDGADADRDQDQLHLPQLQLRAQFNRRRSAAGTGDGDQ